MEVFVDGLLVFVGGATVGADGLVVTREVCVVEGGGNEGGGLQWLVRLLGTQ
jgi:hypothetical protein